MLGGKSDKNTKIFILITLLFIFSNLYTDIYAHSGRTDSSGGHYNSSTGEYHYHHGYSAHQHIDGICPYYNKIDDDNTTNKNETASNNSSDSLNEVIEEMKKEKNEDELDWTGIICFILTIVLIGLVFYQSSTINKTEYIYCIYCKTKNKTKNTNCYMCGKELHK